MRKFDSADLAGPVDWSGPTIAGFANAVAKLRWISTPYRWHRNTATELFVVLDGEVDMHVRNHAGEEAKVIALTGGQMLLIEPGEEHVAHPRGEARILVVEEEHED